MWLFLSHAPPNCMSHWGILLCYFLEPPASIVIYTVKYAGCDLIPYIPLQIRAVSVQDYPGNSCKAASPQLISLWMSRELSYALERVLQTTVYHSLTLSHLLNMFDMQNTWLGFSDLTFCPAFVMGAWGSSDWGKELSFYSAASCWMQMVCF